MNAELQSLAADAKALAKRYRSITGKPLGVTGEIAELEAARVLGLTLEPARQPGWDAVGTRSDGSTERLQIKGRWMAEGYKASARVGSIAPHAEFDAVLLVLLDADLNAQRIYRLEQDEVRALLNAPGSRSRNERGMLSLGTFERLGRLVWVRPSDQLPLSDATASAQHLEARLIAYLQQEGVLSVLCGAKQLKTFNRREQLLEQAVADLVRSEPTVTSVTVTQRLRETLGVSCESYPYRTRPDIVVQRGEQLEILEVKSGRVDYSRFDCVVGKDMRAQLELLGLPDLKPTEVEQDLLRLQSCRSVSPRIASATLVLVDAYAGNGRSWTRVFTNADTFASTMQIPALRAQAAAFVAGTKVHTLDGGDMPVRLIVVDVPEPTHRI